MSRYGYHPMVAPSHLDIESKRGELLPSAFRHADGIGERFLHRLLEFLSDARDVILLYDSIDDFQKTSLRPSLARSAILISESLSSPG